MTASLVLLDPTSERSPVARALAVRPPSLHGMAVAVLDISKARGNVFLDRVAELLAAQGVTVNRYREHPVHPRREMTAALAAQRLDGDRRDDQHAGRP